jgi:cytochrome c
MRSPQTGSIFFCLATALAVTCFTTSAAALDVSAAEALAKSNGCTKCHTVEKKKDGPAYRDVAAKFKDKADKVDKIIFHITSGEKVKFPDGHEEDHKKIKTKDPVEIRNLVDWILSLEGGTKY